MDINDIKINNNESEKSITLFNFEEIYNSGQDFVKSFSSIFDTVSNFLKIGKEFYEQITNKIDMFDELANEISLASTIIRTSVEQISESLIQVQAIEKLSKLQLIWLDYIDSQLAYDIIHNGDIERIIVNHLINSNYDVVNNTIEETKKLGLLSQKDTLYCQSVNAYCNEQYELACVGFVVIVEYLTSKISRDIGTNVKKHIDIILNKINTKEIFNKFDYKLISIILFFKAITDSLYKNLKFSKQESDNLNRHWILHGRTQRNYSKFDCIKLINYIYAILFISDLNYDK